MKKMEIASPTHKRLLLLLETGLPIPAYKLRRQLSDPTTSKENLQMHLSNLRKILRGHGMDIIYTVAFKLRCYQMVKLLKPAVQHYKNRPKRRRYAKGEERPPRWGRFDPNKSIRMLPRLQYKARQELKEIQRREQGSMA